MIWNCDHHEAVTKKVLAMQVYQGLKFSSILAALFTTGHICNEARRNFQNENWVKWIVDNLRKGGQIMTLSIMCYIQLLVAIQEFLICNKHSCMQFPITFLNSGL